MEFNICSQEVNIKSGAHMFHICCSLGKLSPAQALDLISSSNYVMIDIRSENDKNKAGIPRLPSSAKNKMIAIP